MGMSVQEFLSDGELDDLPLSALPILVTNASAKVEEPIVSQQSHIVSSIAYGASVSTISTQLDP